MSILQSAETIATQNGCCGETIRRLYRAGRIPGYRVGRNLRFDPDEVREALRSGPTGITVVATGHVAPDFDAIA
jgi:excisionase family DNA binding protein